MAAVLTQELLDEREEQGQRTRLGQYQRFFLVPLIALAFFGAVSMAAPKEAQAAGYWYETKMTDGTVQWCFWEQTSWGGYWDGCQFEYGGYLHYDKVGSNQILVLMQGYWWDVTDYWYASPFLTQTISFNTNENAVSNLVTSLAGLTGQPDYAIGYSSSTMASSSGVAPKDNQAMEAPPAPGMSQPEEGTQQTTQTMQTTSTFPWKVAQDDSRNFSYSGWSKVYTSKAQGGSYRMSSSKTKGAFFEANGRTDAGGSTMKLITRTGPTMGKAKVLVVNLANAKVVKTAYFDLRTSERRYKVAKSITGLTPHKPYGLVVLSANGRPVAVDAVGYEAHGDMCHSVVN